MSEPNDEVSLGIDFFESLNAKDKGFFGEKITSFYLRDHLHNSPETFFPTFADVDSADIYLPTPQQSSYSFLERDGDVFELVSRKDRSVDQYRIDESGTREKVGLLEDWPDGHKPWVPDITLKITNLYGAGDIERRVLCEVKTGPYAEFRGDQRDVMEILNRSPARYSSKRGCSSTLKETPSPFSFKSSLRQTLMKT